jgi:hypothetical protein
VIRAKDGHLSSASQKRQEARRTRAGDTEEGRTNLVEKPRDLGIWGRYWLCLKAKAASRQG